MVSPEQAAEAHPLISTHGLWGAAHTATDSLVDASGATHAMAKAAHQMGADIKMNTLVTSIETATSGWRLDNGSDAILADQIVLAASFWTREMAAQIGLNLPLFALQHHEIITGPVSERASIKGELPTVRDPAAPANIRQERDGFLCGVYEQGPKFWGVEGIPKDFKEELLPSLTRPSHA